MVRQNEGETVSGRFSGIPREHGPPEGPLAGVRVLDLTSVIMGPLATQVLGDMGADVITVEKAGGDTNRAMGKGPHPQLSGIALNLLRNKRSVSLDIKVDQGRDVLLRLAETCDVFVTNIRRQALRRARLLYGDIAARCPDVIYCEAHGFPTGDEREDLPAYDDIIQAESGIADAAFRQAGAPLLAPTLVADKVSGLTLVYAICAALFRRERTGLGEHIEVSMVEATRAWVLVEHGGAAICRPPLAEAGYARILTPNRRPQRTADGWINVLPYSQRNYDALFRAGHRADLVGDPRHASVRGRVENADFLYRELGAIMPLRTTDEWLDFCREEDIPAAAVATLDDLVDDLPDAVHPDAGTYKEIQPAVRFGRTPMSVRRPAPLIGGDTDEVLRKLGYTPQEIEDMRCRGVIPAPDP